MLRGDDQPTGGSYVSCSAPLRLRPAEAATRGQGHSDQKPKRGPGGPILPTRLKAPSQSAAGEVQRGLDEVRTDRKPVQQRSPASLRWGRFAACFCSIPGDSGDHQRYDRRAIGRGVGSTATIARPATSRSRISRRPRQAEKQRGNASTTIGTRTPAVSLHLQDSSSMPTLPACRADNLSTRRSSV